MRCAFDNVMGLNTGVFSTQKRNGAAKGRQSNIRLLCCLGQAVIFTAFMVTPSAAFSAESGAKARAASFDERWTGIYAGVSLGGGWGESSTFYDRAGNDHLTTETIDPSGFLFSLNFGYNYQFDNNLVLGIEGDIGFMDMSAPDRQGLWDGHVWKSRYGGIWGTIRPRVGYVYHDFMIFATGGLAFMATDEFILGDNDATQNTYNKGTHTGWVIGAGVEYAITRQLSTKLEYLHLEFPEYRGYTNNTELYGFKNKVDLFRVGLSYKF